MKLPSPLRELFRSQYEEAQAYVAWENAQGLPPTDEPEELERRRLLFYDSPAFAARGKPPAFP